MPEEQASIEDVIEQEVINTGKSFTEVLTLSLEANKLDDLLKHLINNKQAQALELIKHNDTDKVLTILWDLFLRDKSLMPEEQASIEDAIEQEVINTGKSFTEVLLLSLEANKLDDLLKYLIN
jgi:hypothetical protein